MAELPPYTIREYQPGDERAILATFNRVFAAIDPTFVPRTLEEWRWQYLENPSGWRIWLAVSDLDGSVISQYAGISQRVRLEGQPARFSQAVDSMTDPAYRGGLKKPGFFVLTGYPYASNYGGPPPEHDTVMWGLPVPHAWRIGKTYLDYELVRTQCKLTRPVEQLPSDLAASPGVEIEEVSSFPDEVEALWRSVAESHGVIAVRDAAQLDWRFVRRPGYSYRIALARAGGELRGFTVQRKGAFDEREDSLVCEWLVEPGREDVRRALFRWHLERAREDDAEHLTALLPDTCPDWILAQELGLRVRRTKYFLVARNYVKRYTMAWLRKHWYYTLGDTDLC